MAFIQFQEDKPVRFKEFDEARKYIENISENKDLTFEAIDYMIKHKEYYFLLKNIIKQFADKPSGGKEIFDYLFSRLDYCPKRKEDIELYIKIIHSKNKDLKSAFLEYAKRCIKDFKEMALNLLKSSNKLENYFGFCMLVQVLNEDIKNDLKDLLNFIKSRKSKFFTKEFLDYVYLYGDKDYEECLNEIKQEFPEFEDYVENIKQSI